MPHGGFCLPRQNDSNGDAGASAVGEAIAVGRAGVRGTGDAGWVAVGSGGHWGARLPMPAEKKSVGTKHIMCRTITNTCADLHRNFCRLQLIADSETCRALFAEGTITNTP